MLQRHSGWVDQYSFNINSKMLQIRSADYQHLIVRIQGNHTYTYTGYAQSLHF